MSTYRMRAQDGTLARLVYWDSTTIDSTGANYAGPGPLTDIVVFLEGHSSSSSTPNTLTNANAGSVVICTPVYNSAAGSFDKALGDTAAHASVIGLLTATTATGATGTVQSSGAFDATTAQWDAVTGQVGGLTANTYYYLDVTTAGKITATAPDPTTNVGKYQQVIGLAVSATRMILGVQPPVAL